MSQPQSDQEKRDHFVRALGHFSLAAQELTRAWERLSPEDYTRPKLLYPFTESFDDLSLKIEEWSDHVAERLR